MNAITRKRLAQRKQRIGRRLRKIQWADQPRPMLAARNIRYEVAAFAYRPTKCRRAYRVVVLRKNLAVEKGQTRLFDDGRYFFYLTNDPRSAPQEIVREANGRCNQENLIGATEERGAGDGDARGRPGVERGVPGDGLAGVDAEGVVRAAAAGGGPVEGEAPGRETVGASDGV